MGSLSRGGETVEASLPRVFIASTSMDLDPYRAAARDQILAAGCHPIMMEYWQADARPSVQLCLDQVGQADAVLLLVAWRFGWVPTPEDGGDGEHSITQLEIEEAKRLDKPLFVVCADADWPGRLWARDKDLHSLEQFRASLNRNAPAFEFEKDPRLPNFNGLLKHLLHSIGQAVREKDGDARERDQERLRAERLKPKTATDFGVELRTHSRFTGRKQSTKLGGEERSKAFQVALDRAYASLAAQITGTQQAWGGEPGNAPDPWPSAQIAFFLPPTRYRGLIRDTLAWLSETQAPEGYWCSSTYGDHADTGVTACCTVTLLHHEGPSSISGQRGLSWLCDHYSSGWINQPQNKSLQDVHYYSTAHAIRALVRGPTTPLTAMTIRSSVGVLEEAQSESGGWGFHAGGAPDPSFTSYALHGLLDAIRISRLPVRRRAVLRGLQWLLQRQEEDGTWSDWRGIKCSPEATAYAAYILLSTRTPVLPSVTAALDWLVENQSADGSWGLEANEAERPINWVTIICISALSAYLIAEKQGFKSTGEFSKTGEVTPANLDHAPGLDDPDAAYLEDLDQRLIHPASLEQERVDLAELYETVVQDDVRKIPFTRSLNHTMFRALDHYVAQKVPVEEIQRTLARDELIEVFGVYPEHLETVAAKLGIKDVVPLDFEHKEPKRFNRVRPAFFHASRDGRERLLGIAVVPGNDYVMHYASLTRHAARGMMLEADEKIRVHRFPLVEQHLPAWTHLSSDFVRKGDRVLLGYVEEIRSHFERTSIEVSDWTENEYYGACRVSLPDGGSLVLLGVKYCFWGSISEVLCHYLCQLGVQEILYAAKLGALTGPDDLYTRIFCPSSFAILNHARIVRQLDGVPNGVLEWRPELSTGVHASIPTVLEEDYLQRATTIEIRAQSIDNEISQIARAVFTYNAANNQRVKFSALHFATDYVRAPNDRAMDTTHDLSNNRTPKALESKRRIIKQIFDDVVRPYVLSE